MGNRTWLLWGLDGMRQPWVAELLPRTLDRLQPTLLLRGTAMFHLNPSFPGVIRASVPLTGELRVAWRWDRYDVNINKRVHGRSVVVRAPNRARAISCW